MAPRGYPRLTVEEFGAATLAARDLDPVYDALASMRLDPDQLAQWLVAYWCLYHPGEACWFSELDRKDYWRQLLRAADNQDECPVGGRWPRAPERRHWRANNAVSCVNDLSRRYGAPVEMVDYISYISTQPGAVFEGALGVGPLSYQLVASRVTEHVAFGPWIAYKVADMLERVVGVPVAFAEADAMYEEPRKAALMIWRVKAGVPPEARVKDERDAVTRVVGYLLDHFVQLSAPGLPGRRFGYQEAETVLCKWKSHCSGHYPLYNDLVEIRHGAEPWAAVSETASAFLDHLPLIPN